MNCKIKSEVGRKLVINNQCKLGVTDPRTVLTITPSKIMIPLDFFYGKESVWA